MIYILLLPILLGYIIGTTKFFIDVFEQKWWLVKNFKDRKVVPFLEKLLLIPGKIISLIKRWIYKKFILPSLVMKTREGDDEALNERLKNALPHTKTSEWWASGKRY